jgi:FkbM family methyltransferase
VSILQDVARRVANRVGPDSWLIRALRPAYERLLILTSGQRGLAATINGIPCRIDPRTRRLFPPKYEPPVAEFLASRVRAGAVCLDVGANVGIYVLQLAHWSRPNGRVVAFEPNPDAARVLGRHVALNGLSSRVELMMCAVGATVGQATMHALGADGMSRLDQPNPRIAGRTHALTVPLTTIDRFCAERTLRPDWILIDVEGLELAVLQGARAVLSTEPKPDVVVEMHPSIWPASGYGRREMEIMLEQLSVRPIPLGPDVDPLADYGSVYLLPRGG